MLNKFPTYKQHDAKDCGPACLKMITKYYGKSIPLAELKALCQTTRIGSTLFSISEAAEKLHFRSTGVKVTMDQLKGDVPLPCIVHWNKNHYVIVYKISKDKVFIADPAFGLIKLSIKDFIVSWQTQDLDSNQEEGVALVLEPLPEFYEISFEKDYGGAFKFLIAYLKPYKKFFLHLLVGLSCGSLLQLIFPFLTQSLVDVGVQNKDINFVYLVLAAQLSLFLGSIVIELIRGWILLNIGSRVNITMLSSFFSKLMKLPISFFDVKVTGDILQRINDHHRVQNLLSVSSVNILFSTVNVIILSLVLASFSVKIFGIFFFCSALYLFWTSIFFKKKRDLDFKMFSQLSKDQSKIVELVEGMYEIKLNNAERQKRWSWETIQIQKFKIELKSLNLSQAQAVGGFFISQFQNILISVLTSGLVIER